MRGKYITATEEFSLKSGSSWCQHCRESLHWRHNGHNGVSNHQPHDCLLNRLFRCRSKETSKLCVPGLCGGNSPETGEFPAQRASNMENASIWWLHHVATPEIGIKTNSSAVIEDIKNNAWVTVNDDFLVTSGVICQWFSRVTKSRVKIIGKSPHEWQKNRYSR